jgi:hypothetical protein
MGLSSSIDEFLWHRIMWVGFDAFLLQAQYIFYFFKGLQGAFLFLDIMVLGQYTVRERLAGIGKVLPAKKKALVDMGVNV